MKGILIIITVVYFGIFGCSKNHEIIYDYPYAAGKLIVSNKTGNVVLITKDLDSSTIEGVIVDSVDPTLLCTTLVVSKGDYYPCGKCDNFC